MQGRETDRIKPVLPSAVKFDSSAGNVGQVLRITSSSGSMDLLRSLMTHHSEQTESESTTQDTVPASVTVEETRGNIMKQQNMKRQMKENSETSLKRDPCLSDTKSPPTAITGSDTEPRTQQTPAKERVWAEIVAADGSFLDLTIGDIYCFVEAP